LKRLKHKKTEATRLAVSPSSFDLAWLHLVNKAPHPRLSRLNRAHQGMMNVTKMFGCVLVFRRVATPNVSARQAHTQMDPRITELHAFFADMFGGLGHFDLIKMCASLRHIAFPVARLTF
jgi:hypothetical protein